MEAILDIETPCLLDTPDFTEFEDNAFFLDQSKDVSCNDYIPMTSPSDMSVSSAESDLFGEATSSVNFSPTHSLVSEGDDIDLLNYLVKTNDNPTLPVTRTNNTLCSPPTVSADKESKKTAFVESTLEKNRKNAIAAKENRQRKKKYMESLETENKQLSSDNERLNSESNELKRKVSSLEEEVLYLKSVLAHQSTLSDLLKNIGKTNVNLTTSFESKSTRTSERRAKRRKTDNESHTTGGVCLHVSQDNVSLELCSKCAMMAKGGDKL